MKSGGIYGLIEQWRKEANGCEKRAEEMRPHAGHSHDENGTGDEGWREMIELYERAGTLHWCIADLKKAIKAAT